MVDAKTAAARWDPAWGIRHLCGQLDGDHTVFHEGRQQDPGAASETK
jgi:hypothetical protein